MASRSVTTASSTGADGDGDIIELQVAKNYNL